MGTSNNSVLVVPLTPPASMASVYIAVHIVGTRTTAITTPMTAIIILLMLTIRITCITVVEEGYILEIS